MTLAEIEELAREVVDFAAEFAARQPHASEMIEWLNGTGDNPRREGQLARFILRALPVLRAAEEWREKYSGKPAHEFFIEEARARMALAEAIDAFRGGDK